MKKPIKKPVVHIPPDYFHSNRHPLTVAVIGMGGTGSNFLRELLKIHQTRIALGMPGLIVYAWDGDEFSNSNPGRQLCNEQDIGMNKAATLISRINGYAGTNWHGIPAMFGEEAKANYAWAMRSNITVTCVDSVQARKSVYKLLLQSYKNDSGLFYGGRYHDAQPYQRLYYWLDMGNTRTQGQAILSTFGLIPQKASKKFETVSYLPNIFDLFGDISRFDNEAEQGPSCSMADALRKQDLFVNSSVAAAGAKLLWQMLNGELMIDRHQIYIDSKNFRESSAPIESQLVPYKYCVFYPGVDLPKEQAFYNELPEAVAFAEKLVDHEEFNRPNVVRIFQVVSRYELGKAIRVIINKRKKRKEYNYQIGDYEERPLIEGAENKRKVDKAVLHEGPQRVRNLDRMLLEI